MKRFLAIFAIFLPMPALAAADDPTLAIQNYYGAISRGDFRSAYSTWDQNGGASHQDYDAFVRGFSTTSTARVSVGLPFNREGAAGSVYVTVPVEVDSTLKDGTHQHFTGSYTLRSINVPDTSLGVGGWHLFSADLHTSH